MKISGSGPDFVEKVTEHLVNTNPKTNRVQVPLKEEIPDLGTIFQTFVLASKSMMSMAVSNSKMMEGKYTYEEFIFVMGCFFFKTI